MSYFDVPHPMSRKKPPEPMQVRPFRDSILYQGYPTYRYIGEHIDPHATVKEIGVRRQVDFVRVQFEQCIDVRAAESIREPFTQHCEKIIEDLYQSGIIPPFAEAIQNLQQLVEFLGEENSATERGARKSRPLAQALRDAKGERAQAALTKISSTIFDTDDPYQGRPFYFAL